MRKRRFLMMRTCCVVMTLSIMFSSLSVVTARETGAAPTEESYLTHLGVSNQAAHGINQEDLQFLISTIKEHQLSKLQATNLLSSWKTRSIITMNQYNTLEDNGKSIADRQIEQLMGNGSVDVHVNRSSQKMTTQAVSSYSDLIDPNDGSGVHWQVVSNTGYDRASGNIDLPSVYISPSASPAEVPYMFFGLYAGTQVGLDMGFQYIKGSGWRPFIYGFDYTRPASNTVTIHGTYTSNTSFNIVVRALQKSGYDQFELTVYDRPSWTVKETLVYTSNSPVINASKSNVRFYKETTLAFQKNLTRLPNTGTYMKNAAWSNVYLYKPNGSYGLWGANDTYRANKKGRTQAFCDSITINSYTAWSSDNINIQY